MSHPKKQIHIRLPECLKDKLEAKAREEKRTVNNLVRLILERELTDASSEQISG
tara:strand:+ start:491 stop:652 length:162 start_codon:yes stop_codon:yes gene_type:complete